MPDSVPKRELRQRLLAARRSLGVEARAAADAAIIETLTGLARGRAVAAYAPMAGEPGGPGLVPALAAAARRLLLPVLLDDRGLDWAEYDGRLVPAGRGLREPAGRRQGRDAIATVDVIVVPAVAVDRQGVRLGRGGGSFDRALAQVDATPGHPGPLIVAALYDGELVESLPAQPHDRTVHAVVTPTGLIDLTGTARPDWTPER